MLKIQDDINVHEEYCSFEPFPYPSPGCIYKGTGATLPIHLAPRHFVQTIVLNDSCGVRFIMKSGIKFMLLKGAKEDDPVFLVHCKAHEPLGDVFFCTGLRGSRGKHYSLKVELKFESYSITGAMVIDLRFHKKVLETQFLSFTDLWFIC